MAAALDVTNLAVGTHDTPLAVGPVPSVTQRRADAVRTYLVSNGYPPDLIVAHGVGKTMPVADNATAEGRANNRRVEIFIAPRPGVSLR